MRGVVVCGAAITRDEARISLDGVPDEPGISHRVFSAIAEQNIVVDMIGQNVGKDGRANIGFTVLHNELPDQAGGAATPGRGAGRDGRT